MPLWRRYVRCPRCYVRCPRCDSMHPVTQCSRACQRAGPGPQDQVGVVVDAAGVPSQEQLTLPERPLALAACGLFVLSAGLVRLLPGSCCWPRCWKTCSAEAVAGSRPAGAHVPSTAISLVGVCIRLGASSQPTSPPLAGQQLT